MVLEARSLKSRSQWGHAPSLGAREGAVLSLSQLLVASGIPWLVDGHLFPVSLHSLLCVCVSVSCVQISPSCKGTSHIGLGPTHDHILIASVKTLFPNKSHSEGTGG